MARNMNEEQRRIDAIELNIAQLLDMWNNASKDDADISWEYAVINNDVWCRDLIDALREHPNFNQV